MPVVGLDDEIQSQKVVTEDDIERFEQSVADGSRRIQYREEVQLSSKKIQALNDLYEDVVVHDYGDDYHKTEEELESENAFFRTYRTIAGRKKKYNSLPKFIDATRNCLQFLYAVAENQQIYEKDEFISMWANKDIRINGMYLPKYNGKDKKRLNWSALSEYILSDGDPSEFLKEEEVPMIDSEEALDHQIATLFTVQEYADIIETSIRQMANPKEEDFVDVDEKSTIDGRPIAIESSKKSRKRLMEDNPGFSITLKETFRNSQQLNDFSKQMVYDMHNDDMDAIRKYDETYGVESAQDVPILHGSIMDDDDYQDYNDALEDWDVDNTLVDYFGKTMTREEYNDSLIKERMEAAGINIRVFWNEKRKEKRLKEYLKKERERERRLQLELSKTSESLKKKKDKLRKMSDADIKKLLKDEKKKTRNFEKPLRKAKKKKKKKLDQFLLGPSGKKSFKEYKKDALDWTFGGKGNG